MSARLPQSLEALKTAVNFLLAARSPGISSDPACSCDIYSLNTFDISSHPFPQEALKAWAMLGGLCLQLGSAGGFECPITESRVEPGAF